jgi:hypothetical protein
VTTVPAGASTGSFFVKVGNNSSNAVTFTVPTCAFQAKTPTWALNFGGRFDHVDFGGGPSGGYTFAVGYYRNGSYSAMGPISGFSLVDRVSPWAQDGGALFPVLYYDNGAIDGYTINETALICISPPWAPGQNRSFGCGFGQCGNEAPFEGMTPKVLADFHWNNLAPWFGPSTAQIACAPIVDYITVFCPQKQVVITGQNFSATPTIAITDNNGQIPSYTVANQSSTVIVLQLTTIIPGQYCVTVS